MTAGAAPQRMPYAEEPGSYAGWYIGAGLIVAIMAGFFAIWFVYHPI